MTGLLPEQVRPSRGPHLLVIQHEDSCPTGWFGQWWEEAGVGLTVLRAWEDPQVVPAALPEGVDGLVVLGGEMGANDDAACAWLAPTKQLVATVVRAGQPFLGICLGHQLAAVALGGAVEPNALGHATGLTRVGTTDAALDDPLLTGLDEARAVQWNNDVVTEVPEGATVLAHAPDGTVQALRLGERAWGVQFHPEASPEVFRSWTVDKPSAEQAREDGIDVVAASRDIDEAEESLEATWRPVALRFADLSRRA